MIYAIKWTSKFKRSYKLAKKRGLPIDELKKIVDKLTLTLVDTGSQADLF